MKFLFTYNISLVCQDIKLANTKYPKLTKRRLKVQEKNVFCERALSFDQ